MPELFDCYDSPLSALNLEANAYLRGRLAAGATKIDYINDEPESLSNLVKKPYYPIEKYTIMRTIVESVAERIDNGGHLALTISRRKMEDDPIAAMMTRLALDADLLLINHNDDTNLKISYSFRAYPSSSRN